VVLDTTQVPIKQRQFVVDKSYIEGRIVNDQFGTRDEMQKILHNVRKAGLVRQKFIGDPMHLHGTLIDGTIRLQVLVKAVPGVPPVEQFHATDLDDPVPLRRFQAGGFSVEYDLPHFSSFLLNLLLRKL
jgi:hypothetical protein